MKANKNNSPIEGVKCVVNTCSYHMTGDYCTAEKIEIQQRNASSSEETGCATFYPNTKG